MHPYLPALTSAIIFGFSFLFTKGALDYVTPSQLLALRFLAAALTMSLLWALGVLKIKLKVQDLKGLLPLAIVQPILYFLFETQGVRLTTASEAGLMIALIPVFVTLLAIFALREIPSLLQSFFILLSVLGVIFIVLSGDKMSSSNQILGFLALFGAVLAAAFFNILSRNLSKRFSPAELTFVMMWTGALFFTFLALFEPGSIGALAAALKLKFVWTGVLYLGVFSSVLAFFGINYALSKLEASRAAVFNNLSTIVSVLAGVFFGHEPFLWYHFVGGILILTGVWGTNHFAKTKARAI